MIKSDIKAISTLGIETCLLQGCGNVNRDFSREQRGHFAPLKMPLPP